MPEIYGDYKFTGYKNIDHIDREQRRIRFPRVVMFENTKDGSRLNLSEHYVRTLLRDIERLSDSYPQLQTARELINRVKAGFKIPAYVVNCQISPENLFFLIDRMYGEKKPITISSNDDLSPDV